NIYQNRAIGCGSGCLVSFVGCAAVSGNVSLLTILIPPLIGFIIGTFLDHKKKQTIQRDIKKLRKENQNSLIQAEIELKNRIHKFMNNN
ncbi:MAG: hypothetical protein AAGF26_19960, partial [Cyanobacteria bacterium P01_G01_bin.49]